MLILLLMLLMPAPAPAPVVPTARDLQGQWLMKWPGEEELFPCRFDIDPPGSAGGSCLCCCKEQMWQGRWTLVGNCLSVKDTMRAQEWWAGDPPTNRLQWRVPDLAWQGRGRKMLSGTVHGRPFRLSRGRH